MRVDGTQDVQCTNKAHCTTNSVQPFTFT